MSITLVWLDDDHRILAYQFERAWTWDEFHAARDRANAMIDAERHPVAVVFETPPDIVIPANFVSKMMRLSRTKHPRTYALLVVGRSTYMRALIGMLGTLAKHLGRDTLMVFNTVADACAWVEHQPQFRETGTPQ